MHTTDNPALDIALSLARMEGQLDTFNRLHGTPAATAAPAAVPERLDLLERALVTLVAKVRGLSRAGLISLVLTAAVLLLALTGCAGGNGQAKKEARCAQQYRSQFVGNPDGRKVWTSPECAGLSIDTLADIHSRVIVEYMLDVEQGRSLG